MSPEPEKGLREERWSLFTFCEPMQHGQRRSEERGMRLPVRRGR